MMHVVAQQGTNRRGLVRGTVFLLSCLLAGGLAAAVLPPPMVKMVPTVAFMLGFIGFAVGAMSGMVSRTVALEVRDGVLRLATGETWSLRGATTGRLHTTHGMAMGTVVHLIDGPRTLRVASMGHRLADETQISTPPVTMADLYVAPNELDVMRSFAASMPMRPGDGLRFRLVTNPWTARGILAMLVPFAVGFTVVLLAALVFEQLHVFDTLAGQAVFGMTAMALMAALVAWSLIRRSKGEHALTLELSAGELRFSDGARVIGQAARPALTVTRAMHRQHTRSGTFEYPSIAIAWPGHAPLTIGVMAVHIGWPDIATRGPAPRYMLGTPDWCALVEALGMRSLLSGG